MADKNYKERRWSVPSKRAKGYASERKEKVHQHGPKEGKQLTDYVESMPKFKSCHPMWIPTKRLQSS